MTILEQFNRRVIEILHGGPYEECITDEIFIYCCVHDEKVFYPITIGRVLKAINIARGKMEASNLSQHEKECHRIRYREISCHCTNEVFWNLTKEDGFTEATSEDQTEETLSNILSLLQ